MKKGDDYPVEKRYSVDSMRRIVERATQLDADYDRGFSEDELRKIARDLEISDVALERAITEVDASDRAVAQRRRRRVGLRPWLEGTTVATTGALVGVVSRLLGPANMPPDPGGGTLLGAITLGIILIILARFRSADEPRIRFQILNVLGWTTFSIGWLVAHGSFWEDVLAFSITGLVATAILGSLVAPRLSSGDTVSSQLQRDFEDPAVGVDPSTESSNLFSSA